MLRQGLVLVCGLIVAYAATTDLVASPGLAATATPCKGFSYAGLQGASTVSGIRAAVKVVRQPDVREGHVGGWIGIGGPTLGPGGTDQWLQAGYSAFPDGSLQMYYEITLTGRAAEYHPLKTTVEVGEQHTIAILEVNRRSDHWRVWLDGVAASPIYDLRGSHGRYRPQAMGENWSPTPSCNSYDWLFDDIRVARRPGGAWTRGSGIPGYRWQDIGYKVRLIPPDSFEARSR